MVEIELGGEVKIFGSTPKSQKVSALGI